MNRLARVPRRGESVVVDSWEFRVMRTDRRRIDILRVGPAASPAPSAPASDTV
jgi:Mg2+/Co2+ transporter CorC